MTDDKTPAGAVVAPAVGAGAVTIPTAPTAVPVAASAAPVAPASAPASAPAPAVTGAAEEKDKRVKLQVKSENLEENVEYETGRKKAKRFVMPNVPRWWPAKIVQYAFAHPHVRARLEKHMGSNMVRLTDKPYMMELEDRIREVNDENLNKRISARVHDEMERLKRLILIGKTPLKECPPELRHHPVFVFWRMVNREVARASKKRADAYMRKLKASRKKVELSFDEEPENLEEEEIHEPLTPEQLLQQCRDQLAADNLDNIEKGFKFTPEEYALLNYETIDIKNLKQLTTVEELYALADKIVGTKRLEK